MTDAKTPTVREGRSGNFDRQRSPAFRAAREAINARRAAYKGRGESYPTRVVEVFDPETTVWCGPAPFDLTTHDALRLSHRARHTPAALPDDYILDGDRQLPGESDKMYLMFTTWRDLGQNRTMADAARALKMKATAPALTYWSMIAHRYYWHERADLWESELAARTEIALAKKIDAVIDQHAQRRATFLEREINIVDKTYTRLEEMLSVPAIDRYVETLTELAPDGRTIVKHITHWHAANWSYGDIARLVAEIDKIARLHYGMPTSNAAMKIEQSGTIGIVQSGQSQDFGNLSPEERADHEYARQKADDAYFAALEERQALRKGTVINAIASEAAGD